MIVVKNTSIWGSKRNFYIKESREIKMGVTSALFGPEMNQNVRRRNISEKIIFREFTLNMILAISLWYLGRPTLE